MKKINKVVHFDSDKKMITVQAGITWKEIQDYLNPYDCAVKVMQFANLFTVGGSLSVNCNGIDPHVGPLIESVRSIKMLSYDGSIITASRTENAELFYLAIGGLGLFGVIIEATFDVVENSIYKRETKRMCLHQYVQFLKNIPYDPTIGFHFAFLTLSLFSKQLFSDVVTFNFRTYDPSKLFQWQQKRVKKLYQEKRVKPRKLSTKMWSKSRLVKALHWVPVGMMHGRIVSRNNIMRPPAKHLYVETPGQTNLLQEYFIPIDNLIPFITSLEGITKKLNVNLMHVALRFIPQNRESFLSYTAIDRVGIVLFFNQEMNEQGNTQTRLWTQHLIDAATALNGVYYLPIQLHADQQQIRTAYPSIDDFFVFKKQYDPNELFMNHFYQKYA
ncbi:MAG: FAD-binding protein [Candidatus Dependentiae bacterium]